MNTCNVGYVYCMDFGIHIKTMHMSWRILYVHMAKPHWGAPDTTVSGFKGQNP